MALALGREVVKLVFHVCNCQLCPFPTSGLLSVFDGYDQASCCKQEDKCVSSAHLKCGDAVEKSMSLQAAEICKSVANLNGDHNVNRFRIRVQLDITLSSRL